MAFKNKIYKVIASILVMASFCMFPSGKSEWVVPTSGSNSTTALIPTQSMYAVSVKNVATVEGTETLDDPVSVSGYPIIYQKDVDLGWGYDNPYDENPYSTYTSSNHRIVSSNKDTPDDGYNDTNPSGYHYTVIYEYYGSSNYVKKDWNTRTYTISLYRFSQVHRVPLTITTSDTVKSMQVKSGDTVPSSFLNQSNGTDGKIFAGYYSNENCTSPFNGKNTPITSDTTIYARWVDKGSSTATGSNALTDDINALTTSKNYYVGTGAGFNIGTCDSYSNGYAYLGTSATATTIKSGATVNFCMNTGDTDQEAASDDKISTNVDQSRAYASATTKNDGTADNFLSVDYGSDLNTSGAVNAAPSATSKNACDYHIVLGNDLTVNGSLIIGGYTGSASNASNFQGMIIKDYVNLDLNGHTITINSGGILQSFGNITDSVGTGKIEVKVRGTIKTQLVLGEVKGGNNSIWAYSKGTCPFDNYYIPYLGCETDIEVTSSGSGSFIGFSKLDLGSLGVCNVYVSFIGKGTNNLFNITGLKDSSKTGFVSFKPIKYTNLSNSTKTNHLYFTANMLDVREQITFSNLIFAFSSDAQISANIYISKNVSVIGDIVLEKAFTIDIGRIAFPISSMMDISILGSDFTLAQKLQFLSGSSLYVDSSSTVKLTVNHIDASTISVSKTFVFVYTVEKYFNLSEVNSSGGIIGIERPMTESYGIGKKEYNDIWKIGNSDTVYYYSNPQINIEGSVVFDTANTSSSAYDPYTFSGLMSINSFTIGSLSYKWTTDNFSTYLVGNSNVKVSTYSMSLEIQGSSWFEADVTALTTKDNTDAGAYTISHRFFAMPATINGTGYIYKTGSTGVDSSSLITGSYDYDTGIFSSSTNASIFFKLSDYLLTGSDSSQDNFIDYSITPCSVASIDNTNHTITYGSNTYLFYWPLNIFVIVTASASTTSKTVNVNKRDSRATTSSTAITVTTTYSSGHWN
jgi:hypothetical protein